MPVAVYPMGVLIDRVGMPWTQAGAGAVLAAFVAIVALVPKRPRSRAAEPSGDGAQPSAEAAG
jgi:hypothetical protein